MAKKVTIELTPDQRNKIKMETGKELRTLEFEPLEDRAAPSAGPKMPGSPFPVVKDPE